MCPRVYSEVLEANQFVLVVTKKTLADINLFLGHKVVTPLSLASTLALMHVDMVETANPAGHG